MLLLGRLSVISDQSATLQTSKVTGDIRVPMHARRGHKWRGENCRTHIRSIESRTSPGKFISLSANLFPGN